MIIALALQIIGPILTIIGMFATFFITRYSCKKEIEKIQKEKSIEKTIDIPNKALNCMHEMSKNPNTKNLNKYTKEWVEIINSIFSYGSKDAINICTYIQEQAYLN